LEELESSLPDLLLLDISMSGVDGREVCKHLKNKQSTRHIPIVMISADIDIAKITAECGANDSLAKPFEIRELLAVIERHTADQQ
ncbi:MAG: response regulator, partial [Chitinophagaceae bacterium]